MSAPLRVLVTGASGNMGYSITYMIARGEVFGPKQPIILMLYDMPDAQKKLQSVMMELSDCTLPLLKQVIATSDLAVACKDIQAAFLVGSITRQPGMQRKDLLAANVKTFKEFGRALNLHARKCVRVLVTANPCNTMAYICHKFAPSIPATNFAAMARLDLNRASAQIADKLKVPVTSIKNMVVWGNHSNTQVPDATYAICQVNGKTLKVAEAVNDQEYLQNKFMETVAHRGTNIIETRKLASAMSSAKAACDQMHDWWNGTPPGEFVCMSVISDGSYGAPLDVFFSFPVTARGGEWSIVKGLPINDFIKQKITATGQELIGEKTEALSLVGYS